MDFLFDTDLNLFLQSFQSRTLTVLMLLISAMGSIVLLTALAGFVLFGVHFRKGLMVLHTLLWCSLLSDALKQIFRMPRPTDVDPAVSLLEDQYPRWLLEIFPLGMNYGLPSGHVSATTAFWGAMIYLFPHKAIKIVGLSLIAAMALSRMYLGRHFPGDVIGGFALALLLLLAAMGLLYRSEKGLRDSVSDRVPATQWILALFVLPVLAAPYLSQFQPADTGKLLGLAFASFILLLRGLPDDSNVGFHALTRFSLAIFLFVGAGVFMQGIAGGNRTADWFLLLKGTISTFVAVWGTVEISGKMGLYKIESTF